jgi:hypothetical protein
MIRPRFGSRDFQPPCLRPDLHHGDRALVVDVDRRLREPVARGSEPRPVVGAELAGAQALRLHLGLAAHQALRHLGLRHLEREHGRRHLGADGEVRGHAEAEARLAHARAGGDDDQVSRLEAGGEPVEVAEAGGRPGDVRAGLVEGRDPLEAVLQQLLDVAELARHARLREVEDDLLCAVDEVVGLAGPLPAQLGDFAARPNQPAERRHLAHDARVVAGVGARGTSAASSWMRTRPPAASSSPRSSSSSTSVIASTGSPFRVQRQRRAVDDRVALAVEVARVQDFADRPDRAGGEHHRAENRLLGFEILRRDRGGLRSWASWAIRVTPSTLRANAEGLDDGTFDRPQIGRQAAVCRHKGTHVFQRYRTTPVGEKHARSGKFVPKSTGAHRPVEKLVRSCYRSGPSPVSSTASAARSNASSGDLLLALVGRNGGFGRFTLFCLGLDLVLGDDRLDLGLGLLVLRLGLGLAAASASASAAAIASSSSCGGSSPPSGTTASRTVP